MSGVSPSRLRTKTSDLTDFFRPSTGHSHHSRLETQNDSSQVQIPIPQPLLDLPHPNESQNALKKMSSRIPFLGRPRKKSTHSTSGAPLSSTPNRGYDSIEIAESVPTKRDRISHSASPLTESTPSSPPLPTAPSPITINAPSPSLGSKLAAHFGHSKSRKLSPRSKPSASIKGGTLDTLSPPTSPRDASFDSGSSGASETRSTTPRANPHPTITVSLPPDNLEDYRDLFTLPRNKNPVQKHQSNSPPYEYQDGDSNFTLSPTPTSIRKHSPNSSAESRSSGTRSESEQRDSQSSIDDRSNHQITKRSSIRHTSGKRDDGLRTDNSDESLHGSSRNVHPLELGPTFDASPPSAAVRKPSLSSSSTLTRSRLRSPSAIERPSQPPSIPLPEPPTSNPPSNSVPSQHQSRQPPTPTAPLRRPRAHTIGTIPPAPQSVSAVSPVGIQKRPTFLSQNSITAKQNSDKENSRASTGTLEGLQEALAARNRQYEELESHMIKITATHNAEKRALEKKIANLERDLVKKENQLKGFMWVVNNREGASNALGPTQIAYRQSPIPATSRLGFRMMNSTDESGAESHQTSGGESVAESIRGSGTSGTESTSSMHAKKIRRHHTLAETSLNLYGAPSMKSGPVKGHGIDSAVPVAHRSSVSTRSSVYSLSSSATSSASSLLTTPSATVSSLSAIPETPPPHTPLPPPPPPKPVRASGSLSAGEAEDSERRTSRASRRISTPAPVSLSPSQAYAANLKRGRPPSIAQVLEKSPTAGETPEKGQQSTGPPVTAT